VIAAPPGNSDNLIVQNILSIFHRSKYKRLWFFGWQTPKMAMVRVVSNNDFRSIRHKPRPFIALELTGGISTEK
jgi:hypothetical protein